LEISNVCSDQRGHPSPLETAPEATTKRSPRTDTIRGEHGLMGSLTEIVNRATIKMDKKPKQIMTKLPL